MSAKPRTILWVKSGCRRCEAAKKALAHAQLELRPIEAAWDGEDPYAAEVMAQLTWQDWKLPVVMVDGEFVQPEELLTRSCGGAAGSCTITP